MLLSTDWNIINLIIFIYIISNNFVLLLIDIAATGYNCSYQLMVFTSFNVTRDPGTRVR